MISRIVNSAIEQALKSELMYRHGAILFSRRSILSKGYNKFDVTQLQNNNISVHAEMSCLKSFRRDVKYNKCHILVVRINSSNKLVNSRPCKDCIASLRNISIKNIYYSNEAGEILCERVKHSISNHVSSGNRYQRRL